MPDNPRPWIDHDRLAAEMAGWRIWSGRKLFRVAAGRDWVRLHLVGDEQPSILLTGQAGALLALAGEGPLPRPLYEQLTPQKDHPLSKLLAGSTLYELGLLPEDRVAAFALGDTRGQRLYLLHQLFGARGNTSLIDDSGKVLWARHRPPHTLLCTPPDAVVWTTGTAGDDAPETDLSSLSRDHLTCILTERKGAEAAAILERKLKSARKLGANLAGDLANADRGDSYRDMAETLAANLHGLKPGPQQIQLASCRSGEPLTIDLDPALSPAANMESYFRRARKADRGREIIAERLDNATGQAETLQTCLAELNALRNAAGPDILSHLAAITDWCADNADLLRTVGRRRQRLHSPDEPSRPFRRYRLAGQWEVWIGRNNKENDELTHRAAHSRDLWLHAQGVSGSHVILRTEGHPERVPGAILQQAAALAALHSKAKHSAMVPVIYTEQRYVRKPRKSLPGAAVCIREKSLFAVPGIPEGAATI